MTSVLIEGEAFERAPFANWERLTEQVTALEAKLQRQRNGGVSPHDLHDAEPLPRQKCSLPPYWIAANGAKSCFELLAPRRWNWTMPDAESILSTTIVAPRFSITISFC
jgi:hypothetical protein